MLSYSQLSYVVKKLFCSLSVLLHFNGACITLQSQLRVLARAGAPDSAFGCFKGLSDRLRFHERSLQAVDQAAE